MGPEVGDPGYPDCLPDFQEVPGQLDEWLAAVRRELAPFSVRGAVVHLAPRRPPTFEVRGVLAGAYAARSPKSLLIHAVEVDERGRELRVLCERVKLDSLVDRHGMSGETAPTCRTCATRLAKALSGGR